MNPRRKPKHKYYDAIIIGSGIGGLTAGALLAKAGKKVLILEYHPDRVGGYAQSFVRKKFVFDTSIHAVGGCVEDNGDVGHIFNILGISDQCNFIKLDPFYSVIVPGMEILTVPTGVNEFIDSYVDAFPEEVDNIERFVLLCEKISLQVRGIPPKLKLGNIYRTAKNNKELVRYSFSTLKQVLDKFFKSDILKSAISALWPYLVVPPNKMSFPYWCCMLMSYIYDGAYYCEGSFGKATDALANFVKNNDGEILFGTKVDEILIKNGSAYGVRLANTNTVYSSVVISNADAEQTFGKLIPREHCNLKVLRKVRKLEKSISGFTVYLGVTEKPPLGYETLWFNGVDHDQNYGRLLQGDISGLAITCPTVVDPTSAPEGKHIIILTTLAPFNLFDEWDKETKDIYAEKMITLAEQVIPGLRKQIVIREVASPKTFQEYTLNRYGSMIGIANIRANIFRPDLAKMSGIKNFYLVGQDGTASGGFGGVLISGVEVAKKILQ